VPLSSTQNSCNLDNLKRGDIIIAEFPFENPESDDDYKERRAVILGRSDQRSFVLCMITSSSGAKDAIPLGNSDLSSGMLGAKASFIRPNKIQTISYSNIDIQGKVGSIKEDTMEKVMKKVTNIFLDEVSLSASSPVFERPQKKRIR
jgi:mRNA-degrading endonuclease toxin of MazEF toxin-antitoxin module